MLPVPTNKTEEQLIYVFYEAELSRDLKIRLIQDLAYPDQSQDWAAGSACAVCPPPFASTAFVKNLIKSFNKRYIFTIFIAHPGTPINNNDGQPVFNSKGKRITSAAGHMWYQISDFKEEISYGFAPIESGMTGIGEVTKYDTVHYENPYYSRTLEITEDQFNQLKKYGDLSYDKKNSDFDLYYNGANNSCIDFTWKALSSAGLSPRINIWHDSGRNITDKLRGKYEGTLKVHENIPSIKRIPAPFPDSNLNKEKRNPAPSKTIIQKLLTEHEQEAFQDNGSVLS